MYTIGQLAKRYSLSRSTLLYYDRIGLLRPSGRSPSNYRLYSETDLQRMEKIAFYRDAGLSLEAVAAVLEKDNSRLDDLLEQRLAAIREQIGALHRQQHLILRMMEQEVPGEDLPVLTKERWVSLLSATGLNEADMRRWHVEFERMSPRAHEEFLRSLGIAEGEIGDIRRWSRDQG